MFFQFSIRDGFKSSHHALDDILVSSKVDDELGSIRITMTRAQSFVDSDAPHTGYKVAEIGAVHEKSKKAGVHTVS